MRRLLLLLAATGMVVALGPLVASAAPPAAEDLHFDGFCDGLHLNIPSVGLPTYAYTVDGNQTGCDHRGVFGTAKPNAKGEYGITKGIEFVTNPPNGHMVIQKDHTWVNYGLIRNLIHIINSGTWTEGPPTGAGPSSFSRSAGASKASPSGINGVKEISLDGYCDGMHLVSPSAGLGTRGTVDGNRTGCASDGLMGSKSKINNMRGTYVVSFFADLFVWIQAAIFPDQTWIQFAVSDYQIYILNSGTWSPGPPPIGAPSRSSTAEQ